MLDTIWSVRELLNLLSPPKKCVNGAFGPCYSILAAQHSFNPFICFANSFLSFILSFSFYFLKQLIISFLQLLRNFSHSINLISFLQKETKKLDNITHFSINFYKSVKFYACGRLFCLEFSILSIFLFKKETK